MREFFEKLWYWLSTLLFAVLTVLFIFVLKETIERELIYSISRDTALIWSGSASYLGIVVGFAAYLIYMLFLIIPRVRHNLNWFMKFTHELTHTLVAIVFFGKIREFVVKDRECYVSYLSGPIGYIPTTLAPYCIPIYTLMLFPFRFTGDKDYILIFDFLIAFTYAFHLHTFIKQTRYSQTDIQGCGPARSTTFIAAVHMIIISLIVAIPKAGIANTFYRVFYEYPKDVITKMVSYLETL